MIALNRSSLAARSKSFRTSRTNWLSLRSPKRQLVVEVLGQVTVFTLPADSTASKERWSCVRRMREIPVDQNHLVVDVSLLDDDDNTLPRFVYDVVDQARRCRMQLCIAGLSPNQRALLELTRMTQFVRCYATRRDAICALLAGNKESQYLSTSIQ